MQKIIYVRTVYKSNSLDGTEVRMALATELWCLDFQEAESQDCKICIALANRIIKVDESDR